MHHAFMNFIMFNNMIPKCMTQFPITTKSYGSNPSSLPVTKLPYVPLDPYVIVM